MPVDSMTIVRTLQVVSQSAKAMRSAVQAPKERAFGGRLRGWSGGGAGASAAGTATQWTVAWTSMPAACGFITRRRAAGLGRRTLFGSRGVIAASLRETGNQPEAASAGD